VLGGPRRLEHHVLEGDELQRPVVALLVDEHLGFRRVEGGVVERLGGRRVVEQPEVDHVDAHCARRRLGEVRDACLLRDVRELEGVPGLLRGLEIVERRGGVAGLATSDCPPASA
jgi:hypothetical protein